MTKNDLADALVSNTSLTKSQALEAIDALIDVSRRAFAHGDNIYLRGFGTFRLEQRAAKKARDIRRCAVINVPARRVLKFLPCNELKELVRQQPSINPDNSAK